jgi:hypothetical protein
MGTLEFYQAFKELTPRLFKLLHRTEREETLQNSFYEASTKTGQGHNKKQKLQSNFLEEN